jgi:hypothetical protein
MGMTDSVWVIRGAVLGFLIWLLSVRDLGTSAILFSISLGILVAALRRCRTAIDGNPDLLKQKPRGLAPTLARLIVVECLAIGIFSPLGVNAQTVTIWVSCVFVAMGLVRVTRVLTGAHRVAVQMLNISALCDLAAVAIAPMSARGATSLELFGAAALLIALRREAASAFITP